MRSLILALPALAALALPAAPAYSAEGMWTLDNLPAAMLQRDFGFSPDAAWVRHVMQASVRLESGCSASFVSPDGLVLTNSHCVRRCV
ncbi:MAG: S46 family peptidase, partial [Lysobacteraceae bacterium]